MFYTFDQNNSGGVYVETDDIGKIVIIEAPDHDAANAKADALGLFDLDYCECCGERFHRAWKTDGDDVPSRYDTPIDLDAEDDGTYRFHVVTA